MISISELFDLEDFDSVEPAVWVELETELKKKIDVAAQKFVDNYFDSMLQSGCSCELIQKCYRVGLNLCDDYPIVELLDDDYRHLYFENPQEWELESYVYRAIRKSGEIAAQQLAQKEIKPVETKEKTYPIDYDELKDVLYYQCRTVLDRHNPTPDDIELVYDLNRRTLRIFKYINEEICADDELNARIAEKDLDGMVERLIYFVTKHDGTNIPEPFEDIDDWWGDFNSTINYLVGCYKEDM